VYLIILHGGLLSIGTIREQFNYILLGTYSRFFSWQVWCVPLRYGESCCVEVRYGEAGLVSHGRVCSGMLGSVNVGQV